MQFFQVLPPTRAGRLVLGNVYVLGLDRGMKGQGMISLSTNQQEIKYREISLAFLPYWFDIKNS